MFGEPWTESDGVRAHSIGRLPGRKKPAVVDFVGRLDAFELASFAEVDLDSDGYIVRSEGS